jgi:hypothetical protein
MVVLALAQSKPDHWSLPDGDTWISGADATTSTATVTAARSVTLVTKSTTLYTPVAAYVWLTTGEFVAAVPSPKVIT